MTAMSFNAAHVEAGTAAPRSKMEEDRARNLLLASELAPRLCRGCERYHLRYIARRAVQGIPQDSLDKPVTIRLLGALIGARLRAGREPVEILVAGAADTGSLATAAEAASLAGATGACRFTVLDRCPTPLALCEDYAQARALALVTTTQDLAADDIAHEADMVIVHSLFSHIPPDRHVVLQRFASWLKPDGRILFSVLIDPPGTPRPDQARVRVQLRTMLEAGELRVAEPIETFMARLESGAGEASGRQAEFPDHASILALVEAAGLRVETIEEVDSRWGVPE
jgi:hypothetical protein